MSGYMAVARIERPRVRAGWTAGSFAPAAGGATIAAMVDLARSGGAEVQDVAGAPLAAGLRERWADVVAAWHQTTFYLFHEEGWR